jgi:ElaB/YqjD/DUF883 family membrane-anchored ribosome-binding protein
MSDTTARTAGEVQEEFEAAKKAVLDAYANFLDAKKHLRKAALAAGLEFKDNANEQLDEAITLARDKSNELQDSASDYVRKNPLTSAGIAFLGGMIFSRMFGK